MGSFIFLCERVHVCLFVCMYVCVRSNLIVSLSDPEFISWSVRWERH